MGAQRRSLRFPPSMWSELMTNIFIMLSKYIGSNAVTWLSTFINPKYNKTALLGLCRWWESLQRLCWALEIVAYCFWTTTMKSIILPRHLRIWDFWEAVRRFRDTAKATKFSQKTLASMRQPQRLFIKSLMSVADTLEKNKESLKYPGRM